MDVQECINLIKSKIGEVKEKDTIQFWNSTKTYILEKKSKAKQFADLEI